MVGATSSVKGFLTELPTYILPKIEGEPTIEGLINLHQLVSRNAASVPSNLRGGRHRHLALTITAEEYRTQKGFTSVPPHNPGNYPQSMGNAQEQALGTEKFRKNQALFRKCTAVDEALKNQIVVVVEQVFLSTLVDYLTGFIHVSALTMLQHLFSSYGAIYEIDLEENSVKMMVPYNPAEPLSQLIEKL